MNQFRVEGLEVGRYGPATHNTFSSGAWTLSPKPDKNSKPRAAA